MEKEEVYAQRKPPVSFKIKQFFYKLLWGWRTRHIWDMPKKQPCPKCHGLKPRTGKVVGAVYHCNRDKQDFVVWKRVTFK